MSSIDIKTTQNVTIQYELASLRDRFLAFFIDVIIILTLSFFFVATVQYFYANVEGGESISVQVLIVLFPIIGFILYQFLFELITSGQSLGKMALNIKAIRLDGKEAGITDYLLRAIFHIIDTFFSAGVFGALLISASERRQRLGDITANTTVVRLQNNTRFYLEEILKINTLENYTPTYPEIKNLTEKDMLLIRNTINRYRMYPNEAHQKVIDQLVDNLKEPIGLKEVPKNKVEFLKTLIKDYIVLTR